MKTLARFLPFLSVVYAAGLCSQTLLAQTAQLDVSGQANIFGAGHTTAPGANGVGILPPEFTFSGATAFTFGVSGTVTYNGVWNFYGADGGQYLGGKTDMVSIGGISGIRHNSRTMFLTGVFLNEQEPGGAAPPRGDFSSDGFTDLFPQLDQTFSIGDGLTGIGAGSVQTFFAPSGAMRLFLGFADGFDFQGLPDLCADNGGTLHVTLTAAPVPEPSAILFSFIGGVLLLMSRKRTVFLNNRRLASVTCAALAAFSHQATAAPGDLDVTFGGTGKVLTTIVGTTTGGQRIVCSNDKILVAGGSAGGFALARYNANGTLDTTFNGTGKVTTAIGSGAAGWSLAVQNDGRIVVVGTSSNGTNNDFAVVRYNPDGSLDTTFNGTGIVTTSIGSGSDTANSVALQVDGKIVVAGSSFNPSTFVFAVVRYNIDGSLDTTFNGTGIVTTPIGSGGASGRGMALQSDGKIVVAGDSSNGTNNDFAVVRYSTTGSLDTTFNGTGIVTTPIGSGGALGRGMALQSDGKIVVAGNRTDTSNDIAVARYNTDGGLDTTFGASGKVVTDLGGNDIGVSIALQGDGQIVLAYVTGLNLPTGLIRYEGVGLVVSPSQTVNLGSAAIFTVSASGITPLSYQWRKDGVNIPGATANSYTIPSAQPWHIGDYTVVATYAGGTALSGAALLQINGVATSIWRGLLGTSGFRVGGDRAFQGRRGCECGSSQRSGSRARQT